MALGASLLEKSHDPEALEYFHDVYGWGCDKTGWSDLEGSRTTGKIVESQVGMM